MNVRVSSLGKILVSSLVEFRESQSALCLFACQMNE
jgi:hypothetical protein